MVDVILHCRGLTRLWRIRIKPTARLVAVVFQLGGPTFAKRISKEAFDFVCNFAISDSEESKGLTI
jgi:hypothetical protein